MAHYQPVQTFRPDGIPGNPVLILHQMNRINRTVPKKNTWIEPFTQAAPSEFFDWRKI
ncbi:hypothetical protein [Desulfomarina sp.]